MIREWIGWYVYLIGILLLLLYATTSGNHTIAIIWIYDSKKEFEQGKILNGIIANGMQLNAYLLLLLNSTEGYNFIKKKMNIVILFVWVLSFMLQVASCNYKRTFIICDPDVIEEFVKV